LLEESFLRFFEKVCKNNFPKNNTLKISALNQTENKTAELQKNCEVQNLNLSQWILFITVPNFRRGLG